MANRRFFVTADVVKTSKVVDMKNVSSKRVLASGSEEDRLIQGIPLDIKSWLPQASKVYKISKNIEDYIIVPVCIFLSDLPNRNSVAFPLEELTRFDTDLGDLAYKSWKGKPTFVEHKNDILIDAKGVIFDAVMKPAPEFEGDLVKVILLLGFDKTKDPMLCQQILSGERDSYSMGANCEDFRCSICGKLSSRGGCEHFDVQRPKMEIIDGKVSFANALNLQGFECSSVQTPAFVTATNQQVVDVSRA